MNRREVLRVARRHDVCFVGLENLPVLAPGFEQFGIGGEQVQQTLLARAFVQRGYSVGMVCGDYGQPDVSAWDGVTVYRAYGREEGFPVVRFVYPRWVKLWRALQRADASVYYTSCAGFQVGLVAIFCRRRGRQFIYRLASDSDADPSRLLIRHGRDKRLYEYGLRRADAVLAQTESQKEALRRNYGVESRVAGMLVEKGDGHRSHGERDIDVLWVNNLRGLKRPDRVLELAGRLQDLRVHMVGGEKPGEGALFREILEKARSVPNLRFHGRLPYREAGILFERAKVLINTSDVEGFPNAYLQAWSRGVPVLTFLDPDGVIGQHGLGCRVRDVAEMAREAAALVGSPLQWAGVSKACRAFVDSRFCDDAVLAPYEDSVRAPLPR